MRRRTVANGRARPRGWRAQISRVCCDVAVHLLDERLDGREAPLAAQALRGSPGAAPAVEVAVEVEQVGLDQHAAAGLERRAHADVDGGAAGRRPGTRRRRGRGRPAPRRARGSRSGSRARARARRRGRPRRASGTGAPRKPLASATSPASTRPRMWLEETISPSTSTSGTTWSRSARRPRAARRRPRACGRSGSSRRPRRASRRALRRARRRRTPRRRARRTRASNGITTSSSTPSEAISSALR